MSREKINIQVNPKVELDKAQSNVIDDSPNKIRISFPLLRTFPIANANGDSYDYESTKELYNTIDFGYINLNHEQWINVGAVISSEFVEEEDYGIIKCEAVLWRNTLQEYNISEFDIKEGRYQISMEVFFDDYYIMHGDKRIDLPKASDYKSLIGTKFEGEEVVRVIKPAEYSGAALTEDAADKTLDIEKVVASKIKKKDNLEGDNNMFKEFETEKEFNDFLDTKEREIASKLKEDEEFVSEITKDLVSYDEVIAKFEEAGIEDIDKVEDVVEKFNSVKGEFENFKKEVAEEKKLAKRKATLVEKGIDIEKLEASEEEIVEMADRAFELVVKSFEQASEKKLEKEEANKKDKFNPTKVDLDKDKKSYKEIINAL